MHQYVHTFKIHLVPTHAIFNFLNHHPYLRNIRYRLYNRPMENSLPLENHYYYVIRLFRLKYLSPIRTTRKKRTIRKKSDRFDGPDLAVLLHIFFQSQVWRVCCRYLQRRCYFRTRFLVKFKLLLTHDQVSYRNKMFKNNEESVSAISNT